MVNMTNSDYGSCVGPECRGRAIVKSTGLCQSHQIQWRAGSELRPLRVRSREDARPTCNHAGCVALSRTRGFCKSHYMKFLRVGYTYGPGSPVHCKHESCGRPVDVRGYCEKHYLQVRDSGEAPWSNQRTVPCRIPGCDRLGQYAMCNKHATRATRFGLTWDQLADLMSGGRCEACGFEGRDLHIHPDHNCCPQAGRSCGKCIIAYLCGNCNSAAGMVGDRGERLRKLADVIDRPAKSWD